MEFPQQHISEAPVAPEVALADPEHVAPEDQTPLAQEQIQEPAQEQEASSEQPLEQHAPVSVNIEEPTSDHTARAAINNGYNSDSKAHYHSRSADFHHSAPEYAAQDTDQSTRQNSSPSRPPTPCAKLQTWFWILQWYRAPWCFPAATARSPAAGTRLAGFEE